MDVDIVIKQILTYRTKPDLSKYTLDDLKLFLQIGGEIVATCVVHQGQGLGAFAVFNLANKNDVIAFVVPIAVEAFKPGCTRQIKAWRATGRLCKRYIGKPLGRRPAGKAV